MQVGGVEKCAFDEVVVGFISAMKNHYFCILLNLKELQNLQHLVLLADFTMIIKNLRRVPLNTEVREGNMFARK